MTGAFLYLTLRSFRNRIESQVRRAKQPRYALALIIGIGYFYFLFWRNPRHSKAGVFPLLGTGGHLVVIAGLLLGAVSMWIFGGSSTALAFTQAEASFMFPAPISRRQLVGYKLVRGQVPLLFNALIWVLLLNGARSGLPIWARFVGLWVLFAVIFLHRLGSTLVRTAWGDSGVQGLKRNWLSLVIFAVIVGGVGGSAMRNLPLFRAADNLDTWITALSAVLTAAPARYVLWPFTAVLAPAYAETLSQWLPALGPALLVLLIHVWWVMHTDSAFEEAALAATTARAKRIEALRNRRSFSSGRAAAGAARRPSLPSPKSIGRVAFAFVPRKYPAAGIVWKNLVCLRRTMQFRQMIAPLLVSVIGGASVGSARGGIAAGVAAGAAIFALMMLLMGPLMLRGDLRQDLQHLAELKMLPFSGATIVAAEVLSVSIPLAVFEALTFLGAVALAEVSHVHWAPPAMRVALVVGVVPVLFAFSTASVTIQNGVPILFPSWARLGTVVAGGVEMMGQLILVMGFYLVMLALLLLVPAAMAAVAIMWLQLTGPLATLGIMVAGSLALALELQGVMQLLGRAFERIEPSAVSA
ncbi:MAG TPA: putative ABC exporter domain-containing protein [Gemmatimonadaceae bacterium]